LSAFNNSGHGLHRRDETDLAIGPAAGLRRTYNRNPKAQSRRTALTPKAMQQVRRQPTDIVLVDVFLCRSLW
jgi:hypothetical protein